MIIQELRLKNFGKFTDKSIQLKEGMNLMYGENESGKSTIHTFIKGMFFGMERGRGRASVYDTYSIYEPWENPNYYAGSLRFRVGQKTFRLDRNFDKYSKKAELICEDDGEELSVTDGDLDVLLGGLNAGNYENTVFIGQLKIETGQSLGIELKNYATNYYATGNSELDLGRALQSLQEKKKLLERDEKNYLMKKQQKRERMEQEASYVWRDIHHLEEECERITGELEYRQKKEKDQEENRRKIDELRPAKWRIHPVELLLFAVFVILAFVLIAKPWNYLVAIVIFLACGLYTWNRMKVGKKQEKTAPEILLEEITPEEEKIPLDKLVWEKSHVEEELREKQVQYSNLQEQLTELDEVSEDYREYDRKRRALQLAMDQLNNLSAKLQQQLKTVLDGKASEILEYITDGKYTRLFIEENLHMSVMAEGRKVPMEQLSRGTIEQIYLVLRLAAGELLFEEDYPVILDDTFAYYDENRLKKVMQWLSIHKKQVLIFTCQKREKQLLEELNIAYHEEII